ncbi:hypothetical protein FKW77_006635 [Venturia effusa]|uniref:Extracellular membrane protein CFEM domain-containing protein n=1 Tax=Venturia effusa TaxID=50376 RepID=A0A517LHE2_9PEZI|nr:hypothetical protein FKW77_006635 [Venturia effusa]
MRVIQSLLIASLAVTASVAASLPKRNHDGAMALSQVSPPFHSEAFNAAKDAKQKKQVKRDNAASLQSRAVEITDPAFWSSLGCLIECQTLEQQCKNTGVSQEVCADQVCRANEEYCDCFCGAYQCPRDAGTAAFCEESGNKLKRGVEEAETPAIKEKRNDGILPVPMMKRKIETTLDGIWNHTTCNAICLIEENSCIQTGVSQPVCADRICRINEEYCDCFCGEYKCPRDGGTAAFCEESGNKMKRQLASELPLIAPVMADSKHNAAKAVKFIEKSDCKSDCDALYNLCKEVSSDFHN